jgi:hypothetical protein
MAEESKILESLVRRQVRFNAAIKEVTAKTRIIQATQLPLPDLEPEITGKEEASETETEG